MNNVVHLRRVAPRLAPSKLAALRAVAEREKAVWDDVLELVELGLIAPSYAGAAGFYPRRIDPLTRAGRAVLEEADRSTHITPP